MIWLHPDSRAAAAAALAAATGFGTGAVLACAWPDARIALAVGAFALVVFVLGVIVGGALAGQGDPYQ
jgi:hypothetical protein